ncbi:hypothetical protein [Endozoicomonas arenosclerae]|uniref:hypothetical protein n=1 Tax=Endozoicomonas arenosclerae TaxID=1633495 RepID=UPI0007815287|nr:hypothetical protein [Endozoicomonas arenosclerae]
MIKKTAFIRALQSGLIALTLFASKPATAHSFNCPLPESISTAEAAKTGVVSLQPGMPKVWQHLEFKYRRKHKSPSQSKTPSETSPPFDQNLPLTFQSAHISKLLNKSKMAWANFALELVSCVYGIDDERYSDIEIELTPNDRLAIFYLQVTPVWSAYSRASPNTVRTEYSCTESPEYCQFHLSRVSAELIGPPVPMGSELRLSFGEETVLEQTITSQFDIAPLRDDVLNKTLSDNIGHLVMAGLPHCQRAPKNKIDQCTLNELQSNLHQNKVSVLLTKFSLLGSSAMARASNCFDYKVRCELVTSELEK